MSEFRYPGKRVIDDLAGQGQITCVVISCLFAIACDHLFLPIRQVWGKSLMNVFPLALPWTVGAFLILGLLSGRTFRKALEKMPVEAWTVPGPLDPTLPAAADEAIRRVFLLWTVGALIAVGVHHRWVGQGNGALVERLWLKVLVALIFVALMRAALAGRTRYELISS